MTSDRGVSKMIEYTLALAITASLVGGLLIAGGNFVDDRREQVVREELSVIGQHVASNVERADRLVQAGDTTTSVELNQSFPDRVTGSTYSVELVEDSGGYLRLTATRPDVSVTVEVDNSTALGSSEANGGDVSVVYKPGDDELVIQDA